jgi:hypothetical protein
MELKPLPFDAPLDLYQQQAGDLLAACRAGDPRAIGYFKERHPRFLDATIPWLSKNPSDDEVRAAGLGPDDARLTVARRYDFKDWRALEQHVGDVTRTGSPVHRFEAAVEAVVAGDVGALRAMLGADPELVRARSTRVTHFDPPVHRATLLHYVAANGVEGYRQKTPKNAVEVATTLLRAGAAVDSLADMYGGQCTTMNMLVSSCHPAEAGVQAELAETLLDFGSAIEGRGTGEWVSPLMTALAFGYTRTAEALVRRGAKVDDLADAAGLGRLDDARRLLPSADATTRHRALALAAQHGHADVVQLLLDAGEDPNRYNPKGNHAHSTPLHQAVWAGHADVVRLLAERGARLDVKDTVYQSTPLGWATYGGKVEIEKYLRGLETGNA